MAKELNERRKRFIELFVEGATQAEAARQAGYKHPASQGSELRRELASEIDEAMKERITSFAPLALRTLVDLASNSEQDSVKRQAASEILSRAGYDASQKIEQTTIDGNQERTTEELQTELGKLLSRMPSPPQKLVDLVGDNVPQALTHTH